MLFVDAVLQIEKTDEDLQTALHIAMSCDAKDQDDKYEYVV